MKYLIIIILFITSLTSFAQITPIQAHEKPGEFIWNCVYRDKPTNTYYLHAQSDNQFEDRTVKVLLGNTATEAVVSLVNFLDAFKNIGKQFELKSYTFIVATTGDFIRVLNRGTLKFTAGNYYIQKQNIINAIWFIVNHHNCDIGTVELHLINANQGKIAVKLQSYGVDGELNFKKNIKPYLSHKYQSGDLVSDEDICRLSEAIHNGQLLSSRIITEMCKQVRNQQNPSE